MLIRKVNVKNIIVLLLCVLIFCTGGIHYEASNNIKGKTLYNFKGDIVKVQGTVVEKTVVTDKTISFIGRVNSVCKTGKSIDCNEKVRFSYFINENDDINNLCIPSYGDVFSLDGKIDIPDGAMNRGGFDYSRYLKGENIFFQCVFSLEDYFATSRN
jgi:predicted membrane metal-binding protein